MTSAALGRLSPRAGEPRSRPKPMSPFRRVARADRPGPLLLALLLAGAFVPSLLIEFDLGRLLKSIGEALGRSPSGVRLVLPAGDAVFDDELEGLAVLQFSSGSSDRVAPEPSSGLLPSPLPPRSSTPPAEQRRGLSWQSRAPPLHA